MRRLTLLATLLLITSVEGAVPSASFEAEDLIIHDGTKSFRMQEVLDPHAFYGTIHSVQSRGEDLYVVYGTSELSRGWPPKSGFCGAGRESYIRWIHVKDGKIIEEQEAHYESCVFNRDGGSIDWQEGKLICRSESFEEVGDPASTKVASVVSTWSFDPAHPESGIVETKSPRTTLLRKTKPTSSEATD